MRTQTRSGDFFGMPSMPPFYVGVNGMQSVSKGIVDRIIIAEEAEASGRREDDDGVADRK